MLATLGFLTIIVLLAAILTRCLSPLTALVAMPVAVSLVAGFGTHTANFIVHGIQGVAAVAGMFVFAILYFDVMSDAGMLDPGLARAAQAQGDYPAAAERYEQLLRIWKSGDPDRTEATGAREFLAKHPMFAP